jgi:hypothetical protein
MLKKIRGHHLKTQVKKHLSRAKDDQVKELHKIVDDKLDAKQQLRFFNALHHTKKGRKNNTAVYTTSNYTDTVHAEPELHLEVKRHGDKREMSITVDEAKYFLEVVFLQFLVRSAETYDGNDHHITSSAYLNIGLVLDVILVFEDFLRTNNVFNEVGGKALSDFVLKALQSTPESTKSAATARTLIEFGLSERITGREPNRLCLWSNSSGIAVYHGYLAALLMFSAKNKCYEQALKVLDKYEGDKIWQKFDVCSPIFWIQFSEKEKKEICAENNVITDWVKYKEICGKKLQEDATLVGRISSHQSTFIKGNAFDTVKTAMIYSENDGDFEILATIVERLYPKAGSKLEAQFHKQLEDYMLHLITDSNKQSEAGRFLSAMWIVLPHVSCVVA